MVLRRTLVGSSWTRPCEETERSGNKDFHTFLTLKRAFSNGGNEKKDALFETREHPWAPVDTRGHPRQLTIRTFMCVCIYTYILTYIHTYYYIHIYTYIYS